MTEHAIASFCTGYGGLDDAVRAVFGGRLVSWSDVDPGPISIMQRHAPGVPNLGDIKKINWFAMERADIWTAGYPCQPFSNAGLRLGTDDPRHLWPWLAQGIGVLRPRIVVLENVAAHLRRGFDVVSADLAGMGYRLAWGVTRASDVGAPHPRRRLFVVAVAEDTQRELGDQWRQSASGQAESGWPRTDAGRRSGVATTESEGFGLGTRRDGPARAETEHAEPELYWHAASDADRHELRHKPGRISGSNGAGTSITGYLGALEIPDIGRWGRFANAVARWESVRGLMAPDATVTGARGGQVLAPQFVEWMMGLEPGHVTGTPGLSRTQQLKALGNGVVPQQAERTIRHLVGVLAR